MRVVGYFVLLLLALYFLLLKPYLVARKVEVDVEGVSLSLEEGLNLRSLLVYVPLENRTFHMFVVGLSLKPWSLQAEGFSLIEVSKSPPSSKPFDYDFGTLTELASRLNLKVESLYISTNYIPYGESLTLFIPRTELRAGKVFSYGWTQVYWMHHSNTHHLEVFPHRAHTEGRSFVVEESRVKSSLYDFNLRGRWEGRRGSFSGEGYIKPVEGRGFFLDRTPLSIHGSIDYTSIVANFSGVAGKLDIKGRKEFSGLRVKGEYLWKWREKNQLRGVLTDGLTTAEVDYSLKDGLLYLKFAGLPVDSRTLRTSHRLSTLTSGQMSLDTNRKSLSLQAYSPILRVDGQEMRGVSLRLELDYGKGLHGALDLNATQPFLLSVKGGFSGGDFTGDIKVMGYRLLKPDVSATLSYMGSLRLQGGQLFSHGRGRLEGLILQNMSLGDGSYELRVEGDSYRLSLLGKGYSLSGSGSVSGGDFSGRLDLENMNLSRGGIAADSLRGSLTLSLKSDRVHADGRIEGRISGEGLSSWTSLSFHMERHGERIGGFFRGELRHVRLAQFSSRGGSLEGKIEDGKVYASFDLLEGFRGRGYYSYRDHSYSLRGSVIYSQRGISVASSYSLSGRGKDLNLELSGSGKYKNLEFPLLASFYIKGDRVEGFFRGFTLKEGVFGLRIPDIRVYGDSEYARIETAPLVLTIGQETVSRVELQRGEYRGKRLSLKGDLHGALEGWFDISYEKTLMLSSEGVLDLGRLSSVLRSRMLADAEGRVAYRLSYRDTLELKATSSAIRLRSRYLAVPLSGGLELIFRDDRLSGSFRLTGNQKASVSAVFTGDDRSAHVRFEVSQLPILYRNEILRTSLLVSGKGNLSSDYRSVSLEGNLYTSGVINMQMLRGRKGEPPEEYKRVRLDLSLLSPEPLRVNLPEGYVYADLSARIRGSLYEPEYNINARFRGGALTYFEREFFVRGGEATFTSKESHLDLTITSPTPDYNIIIDLRGNPQYPKAVVRSEPPRDTREVLTALVLGGSEAEGLIPVGGALISQIPQVSGLMKSARGMTGLDVKVQIMPSLSPTGEVGVNATLSKDLNQRLSVEHRYSTLRNPKETYTGGEVRLAPHTSIGGKYYSDRSQEVRVRIRRKFDF